MNEISTLAPMEQQELPLGGPLAGVRLHACEVYNWGTFDSRVWRLDLSGNNALLTGDIGSGKSTLVDAVTTLLVPSHKVSYNKAAGAEARERDLKSYVLGYYKSERADTGLAAKPVALRTSKNYSVILGRFRNEGFAQDVTVAQVFWIREAQGQPTRFYMVADCWLSIAEHFSNFGTDPLALKRRLRALPNVEVFDTFPPYGSAFRLRFGIDNEQALDLFHQTVSMKSVGNLTDFVRQHMLEAFLIEPRVDALIAHFDDLNRAHEAVLKAKAQITALTPLVADCDAHGHLTAQVETLRACRDALRGYFAALKADLLEARLGAHSAELDRLSERIDALDLKLSEERNDRDGIKRAIAENGGDRIESLGREIVQKQRLLDERRGRAEQYDRMAREAGMPVAYDADAFLANREALTSQIESVKTGEAEVQNRITEESVSFRQLKTQHDELEREVESLSKRRSNIPARILAIRERLCASLAMEESELPFAGELIEVRKEESSWEGAAERVLHNFALSLLVSDEHYARVADWVDHTHLGDRLVYYRVRNPGAFDTSRLHP